MAKNPAKRPPVAADIKGARKLLDELAEARRTIRDQGKDIDMLNRQVARGLREVRELKAKAKHKPVARSAKP